jgi:hypothetical protein
MMNILKNKSLQVSAGVFTGLIGGVETASAAAASGQDFSDISSNITESISSLPGLLTGLAYMLGILLGVLGILKIKDHVENPGNTPLQHGAIRLAAGGGLFALPIVYEAMQNTIGTGQSATFVPLDAVTGFSAVDGGTTP